MIAFVIAVAGALICWVLVCLSIRDAIREQKKK